ncbi:PQQ-dependent sugar dehydrogenase [Ramlibacter montanisoli]|uniref:PQQ-dependent sugar dehydrogenase n=1 Tax=Ramlibacter montanisoli TaxID=2732512 RepID=UPI00209C5EA3|nr:PQQ-dependent sugar dehydrogenase [Ramlibacter montanisoli]
MKFRIAGVAMALVLAGCAQTPSQPVISEVAKPLPANVPAWQQGRAPELASSTLAPHAGRLTAVPASEIPLQNLRLPPGFRIQLWASGMPGIRAMTRTESGKIYAGTRGIGRVYEITDSGGQRTSRVVVDKLTQPAVTYHNGSLYVAAIDKVLRYDRIDQNPNVQPVDLTARFNLPTEQHHNWKFIKFGPDGKLYVPFGAPCNICLPEAQYAQIRRYNADGSNMEVVATGVRNTQGFDWHPVTKEMWFTDHGRDWMGDNAPEDELNRLSRPGQFFGFPYCHANGVVDKDIRKANPCAGVTLPVVTTGPHSATMGIHFYTGTMFPRSTATSHSWRARAPGTARRSSATTS